MSTETPIIADVLANRYASLAMKKIWSSSGKILLEREFWIAVMKAQKELGISIPQEAIQAYEQAKDTIDLERIHQREKILRHDVKARIEEFCDLAGYQHIHKGMTSRDLTDNVEQLQIQRSLRLIATKYVALLDQFARHAKQYASTLVVGRTHNAPAQPTTLGKRLAMFGEEMLIAFHRLEHLLEQYPLRGIQGATGTQLDQLILFENDPKALQQFIERIRLHLGFSSVMNAVGQIYPRSLDHEVVHSLFQLSSGVSNFAKTLRLMAGHDLATEGFIEGQVGSSAMPHKMNTRSCERINGFHVIINGFVNMLMGISGDQWYEGDVSCSVVRRVALPGAFFAIDGQLETALTVMKEMGFYEALLAEELAKYLPFLASTFILMEGVKQGGQREELHKAIKEHTVNIAKQMRVSPKEIDDLTEKLGMDQRIPLTQENIQQILLTPQNFIASAKQQALAFHQEVSHLLKKYPSAREYTPDLLL